ncbi:hypothetical protein JB92DRAFT_2824344 [Gautieria morchelliformis]|nr:hypothetical protein JB92DRAFT_2824344 [Gautieria morchelliformis]
MGTWQGSLEVAHVGQVHEGCRRVLWAVWRWCAADTARATGTVVVPGWVMGLCSSHCLVRSTACGHMSCMSEGRPHLQLWRGCDCRREFSGMSRWRGMRMECCMGRDVNRGLWCAQRCYNVGWKSQNHTTSVSAATQCGMCMGPPVQYRPDPTSSGIQGLEPLACVTPPAYTLMGIAPASPQAVEHGGVFAPILECSYRACTRCAGACRAPSVMDAAVAGRDVPIGTTEWARAWSMHPAPMTSDAFVTRRKSPGRRRPERGCMGTLAGDLLHVPHTPDMSNTCTWPHATSSKKHERGHMHQHGSAGTCARHVRCVWEGEW